VSEQYLIPSPPRMWGRGFRVRGRPKSELGTLRSEGNATTECFRFLISVFRRLTTPSPQPSPPLRGGEGVLFLLLLLSACGQGEPHGWLGYAEGDNAFISAPRPGWLAHLAVERGDEVNRGQLLFTLDDTREAAARDQAAAVLPQMKAEIAQAQANLDFMRKSLARQQGLARAHAGIPSALDQALANYRQAVASLEQLQAQERQAEAVLASARYTLAQRDIAAYVEGPVQDIYFREGEYLPASTPAVSILPPKNVFVRFFVPETEFARIQLGGKVRVTCDGCAAMDATVTFVAAREEFTQPVIFSVGNREKLVFKAEARLPAGLPLHPGQPVEVRPL